METNIQCDGEGYTIPEEIKRINARKEAHGNGGNGTKVVVFVVSLGERSEILKANGAQASPSLFNEPVRDLAEKLNDPSSQVNKKLRLDYKLQSITTRYSSSRNNFKCVVESASTKRLNRMQDDVSSGHLAKLVKQYGDVSDSPKPWQLQIAMCDDDTDAVTAAGMLTSSGMAASAYDISIAAGSPRTKPEAIPNKESSSSKEKQLKIFNKMLLDMILDKKYTPYDFMKVLKENKGKTYRVSTELVMDDGLPILHACIEHGKLQFLTTLFNLGWFPTLSRMKVSSSSSSVLKGKTPLEVAEYRKQRKSQDELKQLRSWEDGLSSVMKAVRSDDIIRVKGLLAVEGDTLHYRDENNGNSLYWAVITGNKEIFMMLLDKGLDYSMKTRKSETLLHIAASLGHHQLIDVLLHTCKIDPSACDSSRKTPLDRVSENGDIETLQAFVECGVRPTDNFVSQAAYHGRKRLLEYTFNELRMSVESRDMYNRTPLHRAIEAAKDDILQYLISKGVDLSAVCCTGRNILHFAAESGDVAIMDKVIKYLNNAGLLKKMINVKCRFHGVECCFLIRGRDKGREAWHYVEVRRQLVPLFLKRTKSGNVDVAIFGTVVRSGWGFNPEQDTIDYVENLFKERRLDQTAPLDQTPLHLAIFKGNVDAALMLLKHGADINVKDSFGLTPLMMAAAKNLTKLVQELEQTGANLKDVNKEGKPALQIAEENGSEEVVNYLKARDFTAHIDNFLKSDVTRLMNELGRQKLEALRSNGSDVKKHIVDTLRDFRIDINETLLMLGSGPILEESSSQPS